MNDILIHAKSSKELETITCRVLDRHTSAGLKLNKEKCCFDKPTVKFLGHLVTDEGLKADPNKLEAVQKLKRPESYNYSVSWEQ